MKKLELRKIIKEEIDNIILEIDDDVELKDSILEYKKLEKEINDSKLKIKESVDHITELQKEYSVIGKSIDKFMRRFKYTKFKADGWVAKLEEKLKYSNPRPEYKKLWEVLLTKVNTATKNLAIDLKQTQLDTKAVEKQLQFNIEPIEEGIKSYFTELYNSIKNMFITFTKYTKEVNSLPQI